MKISKKRESQLLKVSALCNAHSITFRHDRYLNRVYPKDLSGNWEGERIYSDSMIDGMVTFVKNVVTTREEKAFQERLAEKLSHIKL